MLRFMAGAVSALLLMAAGVFMWKSQAEADSPIPPPPPAQASTFVAPLKPPAAEPPPEAPAKSREQQRFARYDDNEDGIITRAEMMDTRRSAYAKLDTNGDSRLSFEEWAISTAEKFGKADRDRSGTLNAAEFLTTKRPSSPKKCAC